MIYLKRRATKQDIDTMRAWLTVHGQHRSMPSEPVCDFCGIRVPDWLYAAEQLSEQDSRLLNVPAVSQCWRWAACGVCSPLIDASRWERIEHYLALWLQTRFPDASEPTLKHVAHLTLEDFHRYVIRLDGGLVV